MTSALRLDSSVRGYHIYSKTWTAVFGKWDWMGMGLPSLMALWDGVTVNFFALSIPKVLFQPLKLRKI